MNPKTFRRPTPSQPSANGLDSDEIDGLIIDLDGTLYVGDKPVPGAAAAIDRIRRADLPLIFATNTTRRPRRDLIRRLAEMDITVFEEEMFTAPMAAARWLEEHGASRVSLLLAEATFEEFGHFEIDEDHPDHVVIGDLGEDWTFDRLNSAFRALERGAGLVAIQKNRWWNPGDGPQLDAGPFVAALEYASRKEAVVVGKPSAPFYLSAASALGIEPARIAVVGDSLENDVWGAHDAGCRGIAVRTGTFSEEHLACSNRKPDAIMDTIADVPGWLGV